MTAFANEMILASAGSGKTFALTTRFIALLAAGVEPERVAALTFTRKAAGEFFDEILVRLAGAASSDREAARMAAEVGRSQMARGEFSGLLRRMIDAMPRLTLGTMDSYFARIVSAFPFELGLTGEMRILDDAESAEETRRVLGRFFSASRERGPEQDAVLEAFRFATMGVEVKSVARVLDGFIADYLELFRRNGSPEVWGGRARIWPDGFPWKLGDAAPEESLRVLHAWLDEDQTMTDGQRGRWLAFADSLSTWSPGVAWPRPLEYMVKAVLKPGPDFAKSGGELTIDKRRQTPPVAVCFAIASLVQRVVAIELGRRLAVTQGIGSLLRQFDAAYDRQVRRSGKLTFSDVLELLAAGGIMKADRGDDGSRATVAFRIDGKVDHWLLDEFQDTSRRQWNVLEGLVDEAVQDPEGARSLFYVGDVKQAIFSWRGGDPRLFEHVAGRYASGGDRAIERRELNRSYRSGEAIIGLVNRVFGSAAIGSVLPEAAQRWADVWRQHESAVPERVGQAAVLHAADLDARKKTMLDLVGAIDPVGRGFSCAVLVKKNSTATEFAEYLRREGRLPAVAESDLHIGRDNPLSAAFVSLLQCAAFPGDSVSWEHIKMTPVWEWLRATGAESQDALSSEVLGRIGRQGFEAFTAEWLDGVSNLVGEGDAFTRLRAGQLLAAAREFDEAGGGTVAAFIRWLEDASVREAEGADVIRVMTIHKSKGLGFDVVILPDLEGVGLASRRDGPAVATDEAGDVDWILEYPGSLIAENDPRLREYLETARSDAAFDSLARLYVAMTRAKRGLFAIIEPAGTSKACSYPRLFNESLGSDEREMSIAGTTFSAIAAAGDETWLGAGSASPRSAPWSPGVVSIGNAIERVTRKLASGSVDHTRRIRDVFDVTRRDASTHGMAVHALLAKVEWTNGMDLDAWADDASRSGASKESIDETIATLRRPEFAGAFEKPEEGWEAWREQSFEALLEGTWVSAVIDRATVRKSAGGAVIEARVYEFKTGGLGSEEVDSKKTQEHVDQVRMNQKVLAVACGLKGAKIDGFVFYTRSGKVVRVSGETLPD